MHQQRLENYLQDDIPGFFFFFFLSLFALSTASLSLCCLATGICHRACKLHIWCQRSPEDQWYNLAVATVATHELKMFAATCWNSLYLQIRALQEGEGAGYGTMKVHVSDARWC